MARTSVVLKLPRSEDWAIVVAVVAENVSRKRRRLGHQGGWPSDLRSLGADGFRAVYSSFPFVQSFSDF